MYNPYMEKEPDRWGQPGPVYAVYGEPATWVKTPPGVDGHHRCGTREDFLLGGLYDPSLPPTQYSSLGWPECCFPPRNVYGGAGGGGTANPSVTPPALLYGFGAGGGYSVPAVLPPIDPTLGGMTLGGALQDRHTYSDPVQGGMSFGGALEDRYTYTDLVQGGFTLGGALGDHRTYHDPVQGGFTFGGSVGEDLVGSLSLQHNAGGPLSFTAALTFASVAPLLLTTVGNTFTITFVGLGPLPGGPVTGLTSTPATTSAFLQWTASTVPELATAWNVYQATVANMTGATQIASGLTTPQYTITGLAPDTTYYWAVTPVTAGGQEGAYSTVAQYTTNNDLVSAIVQHAQNITVAGASSISTSWASPTVAGDFLVAVLSWRDTGTPTPSAPAGWTLAASDTVAAVKQWIYYIAASASRSGSETFSISNSGGSGGDYPFLTLTIAEYTQQRPFVGVDASAALGSGGAGSATPAASVTVSGAGELVVSSAAGETSSTLTLSAPTGGFSLVSQQSAIASNGDGHFDGYANYIITTGGGAYATSLSASVAFVSARTLIVAFK